MRNITLKAILEIYWTEGVIMAKTNCWCYCPKCGQVYGNVVDATKICLECKTTMINLPPDFDDCDYNLEDEDGNEIYGMREVIFELYVKNNPLYNPVAFQKMQVSNAIIQNNGTTGKPKCPTCGSTNVSPIGGLERGVSVGILGIFSKKINKSFKCSHCGMTW